MTKQDFLDWKEHPVTKEVLAHLNQRAAFYTEEVIAQTHYMSQSEMAWRTGAIQAIRDLLDIDFEEETHGN